MDNLADKRNRTSRTSFNISPSYLETIVIDDDDEEDDEKDKIIKKDIQQTKEEEVNRYGKEYDTFNKKKEKNSELNKEIKLHLQVQIDSKLQQQLWTDIQNKDLKKKEPEIEIQLKIEIPQEFNSLSPKNIDKEKQHFKKKDETKSKSKNEFNQNKVKENKQEINSDSKFQHGIERNIRLKQKEYNENILVDLGGKNIQVQKEIEINSQKKANSKVLLEHELQEQKNVHENIMKPFNRSIQTQIDPLTCEVSLEEQKIEKELHREIEELNKEINELGPNSFDELNKEMLEKFLKTNFETLKVKYFRNLYCSLNEDFTPFYNRLDQLSNDKTQTIAQKKLDTEFLKKLDSLSQQKCNKENREEHEQVDDKTIHKINRDVKVVEEKKNIKLKDELKKSAGLKVHHGIKNNGKIKEKESQQNNLSETQKGVNRDERIINQFEEIDRKEKCQHFDLVIQYNHEMSQELNGHAQNVLGKKMLVDFYNDALETFIYKSDSDALKEKLCKRGIDVINPNQKNGNKNILFQFEFYKNVQTEEELQKKNEKQLQSYTEEEINGDLKVKTKENETEIQEDSDVEIEELDEEIQEYSEHFEEELENSKFKTGALERAIIVESREKIEDPENELQEDSDVDIEGFEGEILEFPEVKIEYFDIESQENTDSDTEDLGEEGINDINEVIEIVEEKEVESYYSLDNNIPSNKICNELNLKMDPNAKLSHDEEEKLKIINSSDPKIFTEHIKEKQSFFELKHQLDELSQEYKGYVQQKVFKGSQQKIDDEQNIFPNMFDELNISPNMFDELNISPNMFDELNISPNMFNELNLNTEKDFQKEIDELQNEWNQLKSEFIFDVPFSFEDDNSSKKLNEKPFNLFDKLHSIHRQLLCKNADNKEWPEKCYQPSSLLEVLFDDPTEFKLNVLVIILNSIDKGYSIKINTDMNSKSPKEYFFNYYEDTILEYIENEHIPPDLVNLLAKAKPSLFYSGCVIAEIHDQVDEVPSHVYRLLLCPPNMSILRDIAVPMSNYSHDIDIKYWSYDKSLNLESEMLTNIYPDMCMDSSPIDNLGVNLQHQVLSRRTIVLNPLKRKNNFSKIMPLQTDSYNESNDKLNTSMLSNEPQEGSSKLMDTENTIIDNNILWKFDFRIKSLTLFKMFILVMTETQELSMLLCTNSKVNSIKNILRFKIQPQQNELKAYIQIMLDIFQQRISSDIEVVQRYKFEDNSTPYSFHSVPSAINNNIFKANHADISQLIDIFINNNSHIKYIPINKKLENMCTYNSGITKFEIEKSDLLLMQVNLAAGTHITNETKENSSVPDIKKSMLFCATKKLSPSSNKFLDLSKMDLKHEIADLSLLEPQTISKDILFSDDTISLLKEKSTNSEINTTLNPLLIRPIHVVAEYDNSSELFQEKILSESNLLEDQHMLSCLQLFHQKPTLPEISILHNTQVETHPTLGCSDDSFANSKLLSGINTIFSTSNLKHDEFPYTYEMLYKKPSSYTV